MANKDLFDLRATHNTHRWVLPVTPEVTVGPPGRKFMFGGVGLASAITAMERTTGRPTIWATAQYLSYAHPPQMVDLDVIVPRAGNAVTQARVVGHVQDREILTVNAALGARDNEVEGQWAQPPEGMPPAHTCPPMPRFHPEDKDLHDRVDLRVAKGRYGAARGDGTFSEDGHAVLWARADVPISSGLLAIVADFVPSATGHALGRHAGANSLDNTIRIRELVDTEWMLCDIRIHGVRSGFVHGRMHIFSESGVLMATASQSAILRLR